MTTTKSSKDDLLHCVAVGQGEKVSLVSPYQRINMEAGMPYVYSNEKDGVEEEVPIPPNYSFKDLVTAKVREEHFRFFKVLNVQLKAGDCIYIPAYWWY